MIKHDDIIKLVKSIREKKDYDREIKIKMKRSLIFVKIIIALYTHLIIDNSKDGLVKDIIKFSKTEEGWTRRIIKQIKDFGYVDLNDEKSSTIMIIYPVFNKDGKNKLEEIIDYAYSLYKKE